jgi:hypothetical protein
VLKVLLLADVMLWLVSAYIDLLIAAAAAAAAGCRSRFPGLSVWLASGVLCLVSVIDASTSAAAAACRSRFPGLSVWLADGRRLPVSIPPGCLLCQAGKQLEWLTGGHVTAGMHEVRIQCVACVLTFFCLYMGSGVLSCAVCTG